MFCKNCGAKLRDGALFCPGCGTKVIITEKSVSKPEPPVETVTPITPEPVKESAPIPEPVTPEPQKVSVAPVEPVTPKPQKVSAVPVEPVTPKPQKTPTEIAQETEAKDTDRKNLPKWLPFAIMGAVIAVLLIVVIVLATGNKNTPANTETEAKTQTETENEPETTTTETESEDTVNNENEIVAEEPVQEEDIAIHRYELIIADITWTDAYYDCINRGGYLAHINTKEELDYIINQITAEDKRGKNFWIGATRAIGTQDYHWVNADGTYSVETLNNNPAYEQFWLPGEPSFQGTNADGNTLEECYVDMFYRSSEDRFFWNDAPDDIISAASYFSGKVGYICEYED